MSRFALALTAIAIVGFGLVVAPDPVSAGNNAGVKWVDFSSKAFPCFDGNDCPPTANKGRSNTIYVMQTLVDGEYRYTDVIGTAKDPDEVWFATELAAECRSGYVVKSAHIEKGHSNWEGWNDPDEAWDWSYQLHPAESNVGHRVLKRRQLAMNVPVDEVFEDLLWGNFSSDLMLEWGEETVDLDIGIGTDPELARAKSYSAEYDIDLHAEVVCRGNVLFGIEREMHNSATVPLEIVWLGVGQEPEDTWRDAVLPDPAPERDPVPDPVRPGHHTDLPMADRVWATQAHLSVIPDTEDPCRIHLSGVIATNGETPVSYRFSDELGGRSQTFATTVDQTHVKMLDHHFDLEPAAGPDEEEELGLTIGEQDTTDQLMTQPTDNEQGYFRLEVTSPNQLISAVASYNVPACVEPGQGPAIAAPTTAPTTTAPSSFAPPTSGPPNGRPSRTGAVMTLGWSASQRATG